jgi:hypothetical protein
MKDVGGVYRLIHGGPPSRLGKDNETRAHGENTF